jgi:hypothetical protein
VGWKQAADIDGPVRHAGLLESALQQARALAEAGSTGELASDRYAMHGGGWHSVDARREESTAPRNQAAPLPDGQAAPEAVREVQVEGGGCHRRSCTLGRAVALNQIASVQRGTTLR